MKYKKNIVIVLFICLAGRAAPLKTDTVTFLPPFFYSNFQNINGLQLAIVPMYQRRNLKKFLAQT